MWGCRVQKLYKYSDVSVYECERSSKAVTVAGGGPADQPQSALLFPLQMSAADKFVAAVEGAELIQQQLPPPLTTTTTSTPQAQGLTQHLSKLEKF